MLKGMPLSHNNLMGLPGDVDDVNRQDWEVLDAQLRHFLDGALKPTAGLEKQG